MKVKLLFVVLLALGLFSCSPKQSNVEFVEQFRSRAGLPQVIPEGAGNVATGSIFGPPADTHRFEAQKIITLHIKR